MRISPAWQVTQTNMFQVEIGVVGERYLLFDLGLNKNNPFKTTIPAPPENPLTFSRSKSNPVSIDLLGLETPSTNVVPPENENKKQDAKPQPNPDLINDNVAYLLEKKESSNVGVFIRNSQS